MYTALLRAQWKSVSIPMLIFTLAAFAIPILQAGATAQLNSGPGTALATNLLGELATISVVYPMCAYFCGMLMALGVWSEDMQGKHVYALSLPVPRWYYL